MRRHSLTRRPGRGLALLATAGLLLLALGGGAFAPTPAAADPFASVAFQRVWARTDQPVAAHEIARSWLWGDQPLVAGSGIQAGK